MLQCVLVVGRLVDMRLAAIARSCLAQQQVQANMAALAPPNARAAAVHDVVDNSGERSAMAPQNGRVHASVRRHGGCGSAPLRAKQTNNVWFAFMVQAFGNLSEVGQAE